jgi:hypothetical protein
LERVFVSRAVRRHEQEGASGVHQVRGNVKAGRKLGQSRRLKTRPPRRLRTDPLRVGVRGERPSSRGRARRARPWRRWSL